MSQELTQFIAQVLQPLHYEVVSIEVQKRQKKLRIFIDRAEPSTLAAADNLALATPIGPPIGIEDCIQATKALDEPLDQFPLMSTLFDGTYELEISSPGVERPLAKASDFEKYKGTRIRVHTFRPLSQDEIQNAAYLEKNTKQKNFVGTLVGLETEQNVQLQLDGKIQISIPFKLISKAHIEPNWDEFSNELSSRKHDSRKGTQS